MESRETADTLVTSLVLFRAMRRRLMQAALDVNWSAAEVVRVAISERLARNAMGGRADR